MFQNIVSLGFFCSTATELKRIGLRKESGPFDWLIIPWDSILNLMDSNFEDFLNQKFLYQIDEYRNYYVNTKYTISFYHDFSEYKSLEKQIADVTKRYQSRIVRFYNAIQSPTLFVRYIQNESELIGIENNYCEIQKFFGSFNKDNEVLFIANDDLHPVHGSVKVYPVTQDPGDVVARFFLDKNEDLKNYLLSNIYPEELRTNNLNFLEHKLPLERPSKQNFFRKLYNRLRTGFRAEQKKYHHDKTISIADIDKNKLPTLYPTLRERFAKIAP